MSGRASPRIRRNRAIAAAVVFLATSIILVRVERAAHGVPPPVPVAHLEVMGAPIAPGGVIPAGPQISLSFSQRMKPASVEIAIDGKRVPATGLTWDVTGTSAVIQGSGMVPYTSAVVSISKAASLAGRGLRGPVTFTLQALPVEPANTTSGVTAQQRPGTPIAIVVDNAPPARPQTGLQRADIVFEYISEYQVSRFTALYFDKVPPLVGPVRSCRMINLYLDWSFHALHMCSGVSGGTMKWILGQQGNPATPGYVDEFGGNYFFRRGPRFAPYNMYTEAARILRARAKSTLRPPSYFVDAPHADTPAGVLAAAPSVPQHSVRYAYVAAAAAYERLDHGAVTTDAGAPVKVKNVVVMKVPSHDAGWVEDWNGHAHSVWYDLLGSGPADIWSDGRVVHGEWHIGAPGASPERYWDNSQAPWFSDASGKVITLNSGLTWINVVGSWPRPGA